MTELSRRPWYRRSLREWLLAVLALGVLLFGLQMKRQMHEQEDELAELSRPIMSLRAKNLQPTPPASAAEALQGAPQKDSPEAEPAATNAATGSAPQ